MKYFEENGREVGKPLSLQEKYNELCDRYISLKQKYEKLLTEISWERNPDRMGK